MKWKEFIYHLIGVYCNNRGSRTFTLHEFCTFNQKAISNFRLEAKTPLNTVRRVLQELRDEKAVTFVDNHGTYTLRGVGLLEGEVEDENIVKIKAETPEKKEYLIEIYARDIGWVKEAKRNLGLSCICPGCNNSFIKEDGTPYIEVHHIIPLCNGGEDAKWNLAVLCAHHHRKAHYADAKTRIEMEKFLLKEVECRL